MLVLKDSLSLPGDAAKPNEDAFAHAEAAALVMDGATPLGDPLMPGPSDAAWLAQFGSRRLMAHLKDGETADEALAAALAETEKSFAALARHPVRERWQIPCASLMLVQLPQARLPLGAKRLEGEVVSTCEGDRMGAERKLKPEGVNQEATISTGSPAPCSTAPTVLPKYSPSPGRADAPITTRP